MGEFESLLALQLAAIAAQILLYRLLRATLARVESSLGELAARPAPPSLLAAERYRATWPNDHQEPTK